MSHVPLMKNYKILFKGFREFRYGLLLKFMTQIQSKYQA